MSKQKIIAKLHSKFMYMRKGDAFISYRFTPIDPYDTEIISLIKYNADPIEETHKLITDMEYSIEYDDKNPGISHGTQILTPCTVDYSDSLSPDKPIDNLYLIIKW